MNINDFFISADSESGNVHISIVKQTETQMLLRFTANFNEPIVPPTVKVEWKETVDHVLSAWTPLIGHSRYLSPNWRRTKSESKIAVGAPVLSLITNNGDNSCTIAVSDPKTPISIEAGISEEEAVFFCTVKFFTADISPIDFYEAYIRIDRSPVSFTDAVVNVNRWWEEDFGYEKAYVPEDAYLPMNSAWYSFHQKLDTQTLLEECEISAKLGMKTLIIDDGWQQNRYSNRNGSYNGGPWDKTNGGFPSMEATADAIHARGAKAGIWMRPLLTCLPVPADTVGIRKASGGTILDPSHPWVLEQVAKDVSLLRSWGYDLIKHDFTTMDTIFRPKDTTPLPAFYDKHHPTAYIMRELYRTIERAAGGAVVIGCNTFGHLAAGIHAVQRVDLGVARAVALDHV